MSTGKPKNIANPKTVPEAVTHLRRQLKLSMEKFAARVGCSFQTVIRWESGRAKITYLNLLKLLALAREHDPMVEPIFANEMQAYRLLSDVDGVNEVAFNQVFPRAWLIKLRECKEGLDQMEKLLQAGQSKKVQ